MGWNRPFVMCFLSVMIDILITGEYHEFMTITIVKMSHERPHILDISGIQITKVLHENLGQFQLGHTFENYNQIQTY